MKSNKENTAKGYKKTPIGLVPVDWQIMELRDILDYEQPGKYLTNNLTDDVSLPIPVLTANKSFILGYTNETDGVFKNTPVIIFDDFTTAARYIDFPFKIKSSAIKLLSAKNNHNLKFIFEKIQLIQINIQDHKRRWISEFEEKTIYLPSISEQNEIAHISTTWDLAIKANENLLMQYLKRRLSIEQTLFYNPNTLDRKWQLKPISTIVDRIKKSFIPKLDELYHQIGIRSHTKGIFYKEGVTGKELGNKSVFWIEPDCFIVNIVFAWEHAIAKTTKAEVGMIASHRFPMYKPKKELLNLDYLLYFFKTSKGKDLLELASPGGAGRNKTLGQSEFLKLKIPVPSLKDQEKIVKILSAADNEIELQRQKIEILKVQKKGLMQKLLTGQVRVK